MQRLITAAVLAVLALAGCAHDREGTAVNPSTVTVMPSPWPRAVDAAPSAPPRILSLWLSSTQIVPGRNWYGRIATTTNVASLEVRTESFSFNARRVAFGQFVFDQHVLDIVPQYKRPYTLLVIARNAAGVEDARTIAIRLH
ncbi:MAG TPA: hypothetical protein VIK27_13020 [Candidatus Aquilonibacter sp.]